MTGFVLDTGVVLELLRESPDRAVLTFLLEKHDLWLSSVTVHELEYGVRILPPGRRRTVLRAKLAAMVADCMNSILAVDRKSAEEAASLRARAHQAGRVLPMADALIAGSALANDLGMATRKVADFEGLGINLVDPWNPLGSLDGTIHHAVPSEAGTR